ncbi:MAG: hypothetical protein L0Y71_02755 [Gemmataceae bacterium]|nr:hypothetical protein [Gemmataceae bacterium]
MLTEPREARIKLSTFTISLATPRHVDLTTVFENKDEPIHTRAIFEIVGDKLRYCVAPPGRPRPTEFATYPGDGLTLVVLKRAAHRPSWPD